MITFQNLLLQQHPEAPVRLLGWILYKTYSEIHCMYTLTICNLFLNITKPSSYCWQGIFWQYIFSSDNCQLERHWTTSMKMIGFLECQILNYFLWIFFSFLILLDFELTFYFEIVLIFTFEILKLVEDFY